jgi:hypothetical protein
MATAAVAAATATLALVAYAVGAVALCIALRRSARRDSIVVTALASVAFAPSAVMVVGLIVAAPFPSLGLWLMVIGLFGAFLVGLPAALATAVALYAWDRRNRRGLPRSRADAAAGRIGQVLVAAAFVAPVLAWLLARGLSSV